MTKEKIEGAFDNYKDQSLTKPRDTAWGNWKSWEEKVGDKVQGWIRDVFFRPAEGKYQAQRGITLEQPNGTLVNVGIKRLPFVLNKTDDLRIGDPLTIELTELKKNKGLSDTKIFSFYGKNLPENSGNKTVLELDNEDQAKGGTKIPESDADKKLNSLEPTEPPELDQ